MAIVQFKTDEQDELMIEKLKPIFKTKTRTKVFKGSLKKCYELFKDQPVR